MKLTGVSPEILDNTQTQRVVARVTELAKAETEGMAMLKRLSKAR